MTYRLVIPSDVRRYVHRLDRRRQQAVTDRLSLLGEDPYDHAHSKALHGDMAG